MDINWSEKLTSRKFWAFIIAITTILGAIMTQQIAVFEALALIVAAAGTYQLGEGLADSGIGS